MKKRNVSKQYTMGRNELKMAEQFPNFNFNSLFNSSNSSNSLFNSNSSNTRTRQTLKNIRKPNYEGPWSGIHPSIKQKLIQKYMNKPINHILKNNIYSPSIKKGIIKGSYPTFPKPKTATFFKLDPSIFARHCFRKPQGDFGECD